MKVWYKTSKQRVFRFSTPEVIVLDEELVELWWVEDGDVCFHNCNLIWRGLLRNLISEGACVEITEAEASRLLKT